MEGTYDNPQVSTKRSRRNTLQEKRRMRNERRMRKRRSKSNSSLLANTLQLESKLRAEAEKKLTLYKNMTRSYWERWRWELQQRKECMQQRRGVGCHKKDCNGQISVHEIDPSLLHDPVNPDGEGMETYIGRGSFAVVKLQLFRGYKVAVKKFLASTIKEDVIQEAQNLAHLCHPYIPMLFGLVTATQPYRIIMQYHGLSGRVSSLSVTLNDVLTRSVAYNQNTIVLLFAQLAEAMRYLHEDAKLLHNDLKCSNVLLCDGCDEHEVQIMLLDFGKATLLADGRRYTLNDIEKVQYVKYYPHLAPEVVQGYAPQSKQSDMYSLGIIFHKVFDHAEIRDIDSAVTKRMNSLATKCTSLHAFSRPSATHILSIIKEIIEL